MTPMMQHNSSSGMHSQRKYNSICLLAVLCLCGAYALLLGGCSTKVRWMSKDSGNDDDNESSNLDHLLSMNLDHLLSNSNSNNNVDAPLLKILQGIQDATKRHVKIINELQEENQKIKTQNQRMEDKVKHLKLLVASCGFKENHHETKEKKTLHKEEETQETSRMDVSTKPRDRALQTSVTTTDFNLYKASLQAELSNLWNFTNRTAIKGSGTSLILDALRLQVKNINNVTNTKIVGLATRVGTLEIRVNIVTIQSIPTLSNQLQNLTVGYQVDTAILENKLDNITSAAIPSIVNQISTLDSEVDSTRGNLQSQINATDQDVTALSTLLSALDSDVNVTTGQLQSEIDTTEANVTVLSTQVNYLNNQVVGTLPSKINALDSKLNTTSANLQSQLTSNFANISNVATSLGNELDATQAYLQDQLLAINKSIDELKPPCYFSCKEAYDKGKTTSGIYQLCPSNSSRYVSNFYAYCDQATDGGGWMLFLSYNHVGGQNNPLQLLESPPLSPSSGYSHMNLNSIPAYAASDIQDVRFFCQSSSHTRKVHFKTSLERVKTIALTGNQYGNTVATWTNNFTALVNHTGNIPGLTDSVSSTVDGGLTYNPFYNSNHNHWSVRHGDTRWECDDYPNSATYNTTHNVWVRMKQ